MKTQIKDFPTNNQTFKSQKGWVYVLENPSMPGLVKIGLTQNTPEKRAADLSSATNMPTPFKVVYALEVRDCKLVESKVHASLDKYRVNSNREFFSISSKHASQQVAKIAKIFAVPNTNHSFKFLIFLFVSVGILSTGLFVFYNFDFYNRYFYNWQSFILLIQKWLENPWVVLFDLSLVLGILFLMFEQKPKRSFKNKRSKQWVKRKKPYIRS